MQIFILFFLMSIVQRNGEEEPNRMEFFKMTHYSETKGWTSPEAQADYVRFYK